MHVEVVGPTEELGDVHDPAQAKRRSRAVDRQVEERVLRREDADLPIEDRRDATSRPEDRRIEAEVAGRGESPVEFETRRAVGPGPVVLGVVVGVVSRFVWCSGFLSKPQRMKPLPRGAQLAAGHQHVDIARGSQSDVAVQQLREDQALHRDDVDARRREVVEDREEFLQQSAVLDHRHDTTPLGIGQPGRWRTPRLPCPRRILRDRRVRPDRRNRARNKRQNLVAMPHAPEAVPIHGARDQLIQPTHRLAIRANARCEADDLLLDGEVIERTHVVRTPRGCHRRAPGARQDGGPGPRWARRSR